MRIKKVAIIGCGQFGRFMAKHLAPYVEVVPVDEKTDAVVVASCQAVIFAVPFSALPIAVKRIAPFVQSGTVVFDVTSVKQKPLALLNRYFRKHQVIGTHPVFGPQSGKEGIRDLPIVLCNISANQHTYATIKRFLREKLGLHIIEQTPKEHDHQMAHVQALTHFIGRALVNLDVQSYATNTQSYKHLLELRDLLQFDSWELFETIQTTNVEAKRVRKKLLQELVHLEKKLGKV
jgi:prephenate dehydrogenase